MAKISNLMIGLILFGACITGLSIFISGTISANSSSTVQNLSQITVFELISNTTNETASALRGVQIGSITINDAPFVIANGVYNVFQLFTDRIPKIFIALFDADIGIPHFLPWIPWWAINLIIAIISLLVVITIVNAVMRSDI